MIFSNPPAYGFPLTERKVFEIKQENFPSPGPVYDTFGLNRKHNSLGYVGFKIDKSKRAPINAGIANTPAPGQYNPQKIINTKKSTIPKSEYQIKDKTQKPEIGEYDPNYQCITKKISTYSIGNKYASIMDDIKDTPGPGSYQIHSNKKIKSSKSLMPSAARFTASKLTPGPGDYEILATDKLISPDKKGKFGTSLKFTEINPTQPQQFQYHSGKNLSKTQDLKKYKLGKSFGIRYEGFSSFSIPKIDNSNKLIQNKNDKLLQTIKQRGSAFSIGRSNRKIFQVKQPNPGPFDYVKQRYEHKNSYRATITTSQRKQAFKNESPGPNQYQIKISKSASVGTFSKAQPKDTLGKNPGPGRYNIDKIIFNQTNKGPVFKSSKKLTLRQTNMAGVGDYQIESKKNEVITIPKSQRFKRQQNSKPGPGDYYIPSGIGKYNLHSTKK